jgi:hypothetical protein
MAMAYGQAISGDLVGTITDSTGAILPNADVRAANVNTGMTSFTKTSASGEYRFTNLPVGTYDIIVSGGGLTGSLKGVPVVLNQTATANLSLGVKTTSETVEVNAESAIIDTTTPQLQSTFEQKEIQDLPSAGIGLGVLNLSLLSPGVAQTGGLGVGRGPSVGGQRPRNNNFTIEGVDNNNKGVTGPLVSVPNDAVQNFTLLENQFSAEFGHSSGGQFNTVVVSGTNKFHGRLYEYFQNRNLNAIDAATVRNGNTTNPRFDQNRLGFQIGGPIKKDKLFFFSNFEYNPLANGISSSVCSPTAAGYATLATLPGISQNNLQQFQKFAKPATDFNANDVAAICPGPTEPVAGKDIAVAALPVTGSSYNNTYISTNSVDWNISDKDQLRGRYIYNKVDQLDTSANLPAFFTTQPNRYHLFTLSEYHSFTPRLSTEIRLGYNRFTQQIPVPNFSYPGLDQFANITIDDLNINVGPDPNAPQRTIQNLYQATGNVTWIRGNHTFKFGLEGRDFISPQSFIQRQRGDYEYSTLSVFLQDLSPDVFGQRSTGNFSYYGNQGSMYTYASDTWRVNRHLSLDLGLRYEFTSVPLSERQQSQNSAASVPGLINFSTPQPQFGNYAPRLGFAYSPGSSGSTAIRGGFAMAYDVLYDNLGVLSLPPQFSSTEDVNTSTSTQNFLGTGGLPPANAGLQTFPNVKAQRAATSAFVPNQQLPYSEEWSLGVQRTFARNYTAEVRYLGDRGIHLPFQDRINIQPVVGPDNFLPTFIDPSSVPSQAQLDAMKTLDDVKAFRKRVIPAYSAAGFTSNIVAFEPFGSSLYNGLAASLQRRFSRGLMVNVAWTWSKTMDDSTADVNSTALTPRRPQDFQNVHSDWSRSLLDRTHRITISGLYDLPFLKNSPNWFLNRVVSNWELAPIYTFESPQYVTVQSAVDSNLNGDSATDRVIFNPAATSNTGSDVTALTNSAGKTVGYVANDPTARYIVAGPGALANTGRNTLRLPRTNNWDMAVVKRFRLTERMSFEFQAQAFNLFNHSQFLPSSINRVDATSSTGQALSFTTTLTHSFATAGSKQFNQPQLVFPNNARTMQLVAKFNF